jgi:hypothetical protein
MREKAQMTDADRAVKAIRAAIGEEERRRLPAWQLGTLARDMYVMGLRTALALVTAPELIADPEPEATPE